MAKKAKAAQAQTRSEIALDLETQIRKCIDNCTDLQDKSLSEKSSVEIVLEALEPLRLGYKMRLEELDEDEEDMDD